MQTITQQEFENDFDAYYQYVKEHQEGICIVSNEGVNAVLMDFIAYQLLVDKKITISGDKVIEEPLSDSEWTRLSNMLLKRETPNG